MFDSRYDFNHLLYHNPVTIDAVKYFLENPDDPADIYSLHISAVGTSPADKWIINCHDLFFIDYNKLYQAFPPTDYMSAVEGHASAIFRLKETRLTKYIEVEIL